MKKVAAPTQQKKGRLKRYIGEVIAELKKAVWPTRQEALRLSIMVLVICLAIGLILGAIDFGFTNLLEKVFIAGQ